MSRSGRPAGIANLLLGPLRDIVFMEHRPVRKPNTILVAPVVTIEPIGHLHLAGDGMPRELAVITHCLTLVAWPSETCCSLTSMPSAVKILPTMRPNVRRSPISGA